MNEKQEQLISFLKEISKEQMIKEDTLLFDSGILNSMSILDVIGFVENLFTIKIKDEDIRLENFESPAAILKCFSSYE